MESTVNQYLGELLKQFSGSVSTIGDFAREQIPDVIREFVLYHLVINASIVVVCAIGLFVVWKFRKHMCAKVTAWRNKLVEEYKRGEPWTRHNSRVDSQLTSTSYDNQQYCAGVLYFMVWSLFLLAVPLTVFLAGYHCIDLIKIAIAPKIWLIEQAIEMGRAVSGK